MVDEMLKNIQWLGHDGFLIRTKNAVVAIDPFQVSTDEKADIICITHEHFDHCSPDDVAKMRKPDTVIVTEPQSAAKLSGDVRTVKPGESVTVGDVTIRAVAAYNTDKAFHPQDNDWLGFVIEADGVSIYHAGDTDVIPEMDDLTVDIALLPVSGTYVMTADQAVEAAKKIRPKVAVPMHYGAIVGSTDDAEKFKNALSGVCDVVVLG